ncbi:MAG: relaxase/mobilization nuclease domain-containing protein [Gallionella sp.]|nr:relaxase/mobilization nuclease domain-containing protein [Gallionella sp.]
MNSTSGDKIKAKRGSREDVTRLSTSYVSQVNKKAPQAVFKVVSHARGARVFNVLNYIERGDKPLEQQLEAENQDGEKFVGKDDMHRVYEEWRKDFERATPTPREPKPKHLTRKEPHHAKTKLSRIPPPHRRDRLHNLSELAVVHNRQGRELLLPGDVPDRVSDRRPDSEMRGVADRDRGRGGIEPAPVSHAKPAKKERAPRHATHALLSADCENTPANARKVMAAAREVFQEQLASEGYRYMMVLHTDTKNPHVHVVINNYNTDPDKTKLRLNPPDLFVIRQRFAERMTELGLEQQATRRLDRPEVLERINRGIEALRKSGTWYEQKLFSASLASGYGEKPGEQASPEMLKYAKSLAEKNKIELPGNSKAAVQEYLEQHGRKREGIPPFVMDAFAKRIAMAKAVARLKDQVKQTTLPFSKERSERMKALRAISQELIKPDAPDMKLLVNSLVVKLRNDTEKMQKQLDALQNPAPDAAKPMSYTRQLERKRAVEKIVERRLEAVEKQRQAINTDPRISNADRKTIMQTLQIHQQSLQKVVGRDRGRER